MATFVPQSAVITSFDSSFKGRFAHYVTKPERDRGLVSILATDVFDPTVKVEFERSTVDRRFFHLRLVFSNRYWARGPVSGWILAGSDERDEDTSRPTCTLFEPVYDAQTGSYTLIFVHSGKRVRATTTNSRLQIDDADTGGTVNSFYRFSLIEWDSLIKLPKYVVFQGHNDKFLREWHHQRFWFLSFSADESNAPGTAFEVVENGDGHVRIRTLDVSGRNWTQFDDFIRISSQDTPNTLFWPVRLAGNVIALRSANNNRFIRPLEQPTSLMNGCLTADAFGIVQQSRMVVKELVLGRRIFDVVYYMDNARIYGRRAVIAGSGRSTNNTPEEAIQTISVSYTETRSYSFTNSNSLSTGVSTSITAGFGRIVSLEVGVEISSEQTVAVEVGEEVSTSVTSEASYTAPVPPFSTIIVNYVATEAKCDIPFSYTQRDQMSTNGTFRSSRNEDGVYKGVNYFSFYFDQPVVRSLINNE
ncbi:uncharacterized protein LOC126682085 [Mercurialis annua]|uniref:uncharacterized protein LOC126682085 n=1 Tax=Mercurialis annua TaxID=3986 RepID=UPI00215E20F0|nr:uncharacterized protein LOC126682085 [Mercurialis annua]